MNCVSWDKRIRRADQLADEHAATAELLRFYAQVARFQQGVFEKLRCLTSAAGLPEAIEPDFPHLLRLIQRIGPPALAGKARELQKDRRSFAEALAAVSDGASAELQFFARVLLQPYMENAVSRNGIVAKDSPSRCPACGESPQAAVLRGEGEGAKRWLLCSLCSTEWEFRRVLCPNCAEEDQDRLPIYSTPTFGHVRVEACDRCHTYIKAVDLTKNGLAVPCVDELAAVALDLWAGEAGYNKLQRNILGL